MTCEEDILCGINKPTSDDPEEMDVLEKKHAVIINAPDEIERSDFFEVEVKVGEYKEHPNELGHFIEWIELYHGDTFLTRLDLTPEKTNYFLKTKIKISYQHPLRARAKCNLHGIWEGEKSIKIKS